MTTPDHQPSSVIPGLSDSTTDSALAVVWPEDIAESGEAQVYTSAGDSGPNDMVRGH